MQSEGRGGAKNESSGGDGGQVEPIGVATLLGEPTTVKERILEQGADETVGSFHRDFGAVCARKRGEVSLRGHARARWVA